MTAPPLQPGADLQAMQLACSQLVCAFMPPQLMPALALEMPAALLGAHRIKYTNFWHIDAR